MTVLNLQFCNIFLFCKEAAVGLLLTVKKANKEQYLFRGCQQLSFVPINSQLAARRGEELKWWSVKA